MLIHLFPTLLAGILAQLTVVLNQINERIVQELTGMATRAHALQEHGAERARQDIEETSMWPLKVSCPRASVNVTIFCTECLAFDFLARVLAGILHTEQSVGASCVTLQDTAARVG